MEKVTAKFLMRSGQIITCVMKPPLKQTIKFPVSGYEFEFTYSFALITGGENPKINAVYYHEKKKENLNENE